MVNALLVEAWRKNVSDIHIEPNPQSRYCVPLRLDGTASNFGGCASPWPRPIVSRISEDHVVSGTGVAVEPISLAVSKYSNTFFQLP